MAPIVMEAHQIWLLWVAVEVDMARAPPADAAMTATIHHDTHGQQGRGGAHLLGHEGTNAGEGFNLSYLNSDGEVVYHTRRTIPLAALFFCFPNIYVELSKPTPRLL